MPEKQSDQEYDNELEPKKFHKLLSEKKKEKLIKLVVQENLTIYRAAKRLRICHPTAKFILKNYRKNSGVKAQEPSQQPQVIIKQMDQERSNYQVKQEDDPFPVAKVQENPPNIAQYHYQHLMMAYPGNWVFPAANQSLDQNFGY